MRRRNAKVIRNKLSEQFDVVLLICITAILRIWRIAWLGWDGSSSLSILRSLLELKHLPETLFDEVNASLTALSPRKLVWTSFSPTSQDAILKACQFDFSLAKSHAMDTWVTSEWLTKHERTSEWMTEFTGWLCLCVPGWVTDTCLCLRLCPCFRLCLSTHVSIHSYVKMCVRVCMCMYLPVCIPVHSCSRTPGTGNPAGTLLESCRDLPESFAGTPC